MLLSNQSPRVRRALQGTSCKNFGKTNSITSISNLFSPNSPPALSDAKLLCSLLISIKPILLSFLGFRDTWRQFSKRLLWWRLRQLYPVISSSAANADLIQRGEHKLKREAQHLLFLSWFKIMKIIYCLQKLVFVVSDTFPTPGHQICQSAKILYSELKFGICHLQSD